MTDRETLRRIHASVSMYAHWGWIAIGLVAGTWLAYAIQLGLSGIVGTSDNVIDIEIFVALVVTVAPAFALRHAIAERALSREIAWSRAQPFRVVGYLDVLGAKQTKGRFAIEVAYALPRSTDEPATSFREPAHRASVELPAPDAFRRVAGDVQRMDTHTQRVETTFGDDETYNQTNTHVVRWLHRVVALLVRLHAIHPIEELRVIGYVA
jgi:hypothetical protein